MLLLCISCGARPAASPDIQIQITADGISREWTVASGTTVANALGQAGVLLGELDRVNPPLFTLLADRAWVHVIRVAETYEVETVTVPFERQVVRNDSLPPEETRIVQAGRNGRQEITYRVVSEDGVVVSRTPLKSMLLDEPVAEIVMVGALSGFRTLAISGALSYVDSSNAWLMTGDTGHRLPLVASGNLDSRIFSLSPDRGWLLYSTRSERGINALYALSLTATGTPVLMPFFDAPLFAEWSPTAPRTLAYSTVMPVSTAQRWQANNDLRMLTLDEKGGSAEPLTLLAPNAEGLYAWWGTAFTWSPDGRKIAYARANEAGWLEVADRTIHRLADITPFSARADWVWLPPIAWSADGAFLLAVQHGSPTGLETPESSPVFNLVALPFAGGSPIILAERTGMFAYPVCGPLQGAGAARGYNVAFLQALRPLESDRSKYRLMVMDRDGSNLRALFPPAGEQGLEPQQVKWSPDGAQIALRYQGNLWIVDVASGIGQQITSDGQITALDWR